MKKSPIASYVGWLLLFSALGFYGYGVVYAIIETFGEEPEKFPEIIASTVSSLQAILLANLGMLLGISVVKPNSAVARQLTFVGDPATRGFQELSDPLELREKVQLWGLVIYVISLVACLIVWVKKDFSFKTGDVVPLIAESAKMFLGVVLAYVTVILGKPSPAGNTEGRSLIRRRGFKTETEAEPNFSFEITVPEGVALTVIDIDGTKIEGKELENLGQQAVNGVIKGSKFVPLALETIFFVVTAVGEPNREVKAALKFFGKNVELDPADFMIESDGRGLLAVKNIELP